MHMHMCMHMHMHMHMWWGAGWVGQLAWCFTVDGCHRRLAVP
jgi:hypothetical protein